MSFYPDLLPTNGWNTAVPNLLLALTFAKSWVARAHDTADYERALADYRRAVRLGRLLRQEDVTIIADLVGLACVRYGAEGIYDRARAEGDPELALLASVVLGEIAPQRLLTSERLTNVDIADHVGKSWWGGLALDLPDDKLERLIERAENDPDRRFRLEALLALNFVRYLGTGAQRRTALEVLNAKAESPDPITAEMARWSRDNEPAGEWVESLLE